MVPILRDTYEKCHPKPYGRSVNGPEEDRYSISVRQDEHKRLSHVHF